MIIIDILAGLAGPWRGSRTVGIHGLGTVDGEFAVRDDEEVGLGRVHVKGELWNAICPSRLAPILRDGDTVDTHLSLEKSSTSGTDGTES